MKIEILKAAIWVLTYAGIFAIMNFVWEWLDTMQFGSPQPSVADSIAGTVLAVIVANSLTRRIKLD